MDTFGPLGQWRINDNLYMYESFVIDLVFRVKYTKAIVFLLANSLGTGYMKQQACCLSSNFSGATWIKVHLLVIFHLFWASMRKNLSNRGSHSLFNWHVENKDWEVERVWSSQWEVVVCEEGVTPSLMWRMKFEKNPFTLPHGANAVVKK